MQNKIIIGTIYSIIAFCIISYISVMLSLITTIGDPSKKPITNIGYPFKYYYQFWLNGSDSPNCGWRISNFHFDILIIWSITLLSYFIVTKKTGHINSSK